MDHVSDLRRAVTGKLLFKDLFVDGKWISTELHAFHDAGLIWSEGGKLVLENYDEGAGPARIAYRFSDRSDMLRLMYQLMMNKMGISRIEQNPEEILDVGPDQSEGKVFL